ncbi:MAG: metalloregulator ArsR/SmtB family transcription factor [bacterium]
MPSAVAEAAPLFAALGDETRLRLVARLGDGTPRSITSLTEGEGMTRQAITKHLHVLAEAGMVRGERRGREQVWALERERLDAARKWIDELSAQWDSALERLRIFVEER